ncbi:MAG: ferrous iron transporter B [Elusimicrobia bacterium]|nr:ferrous iron transporter B [Elusimicrobiota bacterium]
MPVTSSVSVGAPAKTRTLVLVGNPNVGKSVIFGRLTGQYATVSNYPGTTVEVSSGWSWLAGGKWRVIDTPGVNSLLPSSEDERVTRDYLLKERPDAVLAVLDSKNLRRGLLTTLELVDYGIPMVVALNLADEALDRGIAVDAAGLSRHLGVPVVPTVATTGEGMAELKRAVERAARPILSTRDPSEIGRALETLAPLLGEGNPAARAVGLALLSGDDTVLTWRREGGSSEAALFQAAERERARFARPPRQILFDGREARVREICAEVMSIRGRLAPKISQRLGQWALRPWPGFLIAGLVLYGVYEFVGVFGAGMAVNFLEKTVFGQWITPGATWLTEKILPWPFARDLLVGPYGVVSMAFSYAFALILPIVATFFLAFGLLEDSGYLPRLSVLLDRVFRLMGLNGARGPAHDSRARVRYHGHHDHADFGHEKRKDDRDPSAGPFGALFGPAGGDPGDGGRALAEGPGGVALCTRGDDPRHRMGGFPNTSRGALDFSHGDPADPSATLSEHLDENAGEVDVVFERGGASLRLRNPRALFLGPLGMAQGGGAGVLSHRSTMARASRPGHRGVSGGVSSSGLRGGGPLLASEGGALGFAAGDGEPGPYHAFHALRGPVAHDVQGAGMERGADHHGGGAGGGVGDFGGAEPGDSFFSVVGGWVE